jgi:large subunit ribosomal protein L17
MRHARGYRRLNRTHEHRKALFANMAGSLIEHEQIKTTLPKAKELAPGRRKADHARQARRPARPPPGRGPAQAGRHVAKLFDVLGPRYAERRAAMCAC